MGQDREVQRGRPRGRGRLLLRGLNASVTGNAQAFGFSITVTVTYGVASAAEGNPTLPELMGFALSAVAAFSLLNLIVAHLVKADGSTTETTRALLIGTATDFLAVGAAVGAAMGVARAVHGWGSWVLAPLCAGIIYVLVQSVELAVGLAREDPDDDADGESG